MSAVVVTTYTCQPAVTLLLVLQPEFSHNVQTYNKSVYLRVSDAQRCRVHSTMLLPMYMEAARDHPFAVFEVCQTEKNVLFPSLVDLFQRCLEVSTDCLLTVSSQPISHRGYVELCILACLLTHPCCGRM